MDRMTAVSTRRHAARGRWRGSSSTWGSQTKESCRRPWRFNLRPLDQLKLFDSEKPYWTELSVTAKY